MAGMLPDRRGTALYLLVWLLLAGIFAGMMAAGGPPAAAGGDSTAWQAPALHWLNALLFAVPVTMVYAIASGFSARALCRAFPLAERRLGSVFGVFTLAALLSAGFWLLLGHLWNDILLMTGLAWAGIVFSANLSWLMFGFGVLLYGLGAVVQYLFIEFRRAQLAAAGEMQSQMLAQDAQLRMLRTQIDPHFLFNSLNSISALTSINPQKARDMTQQLADFFRLSLGLEAHKKVTLQDEMRMIHHFLAVEKVRFDTRLQLETDIADAATACLLPPMLIQPLVENAIKHGIAHLTEGGSIRIVAMRAGSLLRIRVENDIDPDLPASAGQGAGRAGHGIGLANVRQRLAMTYAHEASIHWQRTATRFVVELSLPFDDGTAAPP